MERIGEREGEGAKSTKQEGNRIDAELAIGEDIGDDIVGDDIFDDDDDDDGDDGDVRDDFGDVDDDDNVVDGIFDNVDVDCWMKMSIHSGGEAIEMGQLSLMCSGLHCSIESMSIEDAAVSREEVVLGVEEFVLGTTLTLLIFLDETHLPVLMLQWCSDAHSGYLG